MGVVAIADDVVASIASIAACEIEGVSSVATGGKGVKVNIAGEEVSIAMIISVDFGSNIPKTSVLVQDKVKNSVESMTGLKVTKVNVTVSSVNVK